MDLLSNPWAGMALVGVLALIIGSHLNVCIVRLPQGQSILTPESSCVRCRTPIRWYDNIPVLSYLLLRGRCRSCREGISIRYPIVELTTLAILLYLFGWEFQRPGGHRDWGIFLGQLLVVSALIVSTFIDFEHRIIPDEVTMPLILLSPVLSAIYPRLHVAPWPLDLGTAAVASGTWEAVVSSLAGIAVGGGMVWGLGIAGSYLFKKEAMGFGDVKLMAMVGGLLGWQVAFLAFWIAPLMGLVYGVIAWLRTGDRYMPYGPFLSLATLVAMAHRVDIARWLAGLSGAA
ncbi:MAG: prepilin peptidase [Planctomycetes bacterium]|nr:prepilin peptidase [Planctomycetota bacterium]